MGNSADTRTDMHKTGTDLRRHTLLSGAEAPYVTWRRRVLLWLPKDSGAVSAGVALASLSVGWSQAHAGQNKEYSNINQLR